MLPSVYFCSKHLQHAWHEHLLLGLLLCMLFAQPLRAEPSREEKIKAVLVYKILKFVTWPNMSSDSDILTICSPGETGMAEALATLEGRKVQNYIIRYRIAKGVNDYRACQVLFLFVGIAPHLKGLLTIGGTVDFVRQGGIIGLVNEGNHLAIKVNRNAAKENGIEIAAPLLDLATVVE